MGENGYGVVVQGREQDLVVEYMITTLTLFGIILTFFY